MALNIYSKYNASSDMRSNYVLFYMEILSLEMTIYSSGFGFLSKLGMLA